MLCTTVFFCCDNQDNGIRGDNGISEVVPPITVQHMMRGYYKMFEEECLNEHNYLRALHGVPLVKLNSDLSAYATEWAKTLADRDMVLEYRPQAVYGENLFVARDYNVDARTVVRNWYEEINSYNFSRPEDVHGVDQFTQVVWKDTKEIGVGVVKKGLSTWIVVNYDPKGHIEGKFEENVLKPLKQDRRRSVLI